MVDKVSEGLCHSFMDYASIDKSYVSEETMSLAGLFIYKKILTIYAR